MPKVSTHSFQFKDAGEYSTEVHFGIAKGAPYDMRDKKVFYIKLGQDVARHCEKSYVFGDTFDEVTKAWEDSVRSFLSASRSERKVIAINMKSYMFNQLAEKFKMDAEEDSSHSNLSSGRLNVETYPPAKLEIEYSVGFVVTVGNKRFWSWGEDVEYNRLEGIDDWSFHQLRKWDEFKFIDWSAEREAWIKNLYTTFHKLIAQCRKFITQDEKLIAAQMDEAKNLLAAPK